MCYLFIYAREISNMIVDEAALQTFECSNSQVQTYARHLTHTKNIETGDTLSRYYHTCFLTIIRIVVPSSHWSKVW